MQLNTLTSNALIARSEDTVPEYICKTCKKIFQWESSLREHEASHSNERPYTCTLCKQTFKMKKNLIKHISNHGNDGDFICSVCLRPFKQKNDLDKHELTHSGFKPHKCNQCGASFAQRGNLKAHMSTHPNNPKPFSCSLCGQKFIRRDRVTSHLKAKHYVVSDPSVYIRTTKLKLNNGQIATCTSQTTVLSHSFVTTVAQIATKAASATIIHQQHPGVTVTTVSQQDPSVTASTSTQVSASGSDPLCERIHEVLDNPMYDDLWKTLEAHNSETASIPSGQYPYDPNDTFDDILT